MREIVSTNFSPKKKSKNPPVEPQKHIFELRVGVLSERNPNAMGLWSEPYSKPCLPYRISSHFAIAMPLGPSSQIAMGPQRFNWSGTPPRI